MNYQHLLLGALVAFCGTFTSFTAVAANPQTAHEAAFVASINEMAKPVGADVGIALVAKDGTLLRGYNADRRFAMCSTFKLPLAAMALQEARQGKYRLDQPLKLVKSDIDEYAPVATRYLPTGHMTVWEAAQASVQLSDNTAANLLLAQSGGPKVLTQHFRRWGDTVSRLDRNEPTLNTNLPGDLRDTTTPMAMSALTARLVFGKLLKREDRLRLERLLIGNQTGDSTIRAGVPSSWMVGDKTGSCERGGRNDVAILRTPSGKEYVLGIYVNAPELNADQRNKLIADATKVTLADFTE